MLVATRKDRQHAGGIDAAGGQLGLDRHRSRADGGKEVRNPGGVRVGRVRHSGEVRTGQTSGERREIDDAGLLHGLVVFDVDILIFVDIHRRRGHGRKRCQPRRLGLEGGNQIGGAYRQTWSGYSILGGLLRGFVGSLRGLLGGFVRLLRGLFGGFVRLLRCLFGDLIRLLSCLLGLAVLALHRLVLVFDLVLVVVFHPDDRWGVLIITTAATTTVVIVGVDSRSDREHTGRGHGNGSQKPTSIDKHPINASLRGISLT